MSGSASEQPTYWINDPPIVELTANEVMAAGNRLAKSIEDFGATGAEGSTVPAPQGIGKLNPAAWSRRRKHRAAELAWWTRGSNAALMARSMGAQQPSTGYDRVFAYRLYGMEVAMMCLSSKNGTIHIEWLATHPGVAGGGEIMIEAAVSRSQRGGCRGVVKLASLGEQSTRFYESVGFTGPEESMTLDPSSSGLWEAVGDDGWRLRKNRDKSYASSSRPPV